MDVQKLSAGGTAEELSVGFETALRRRIDTVLPDEKKPKKRKKKNQDEEDEEEVDIPDVRGKKMISKETYSNLREYHRLWLQALTNEEIIPLQTTTDDQIYLEVRKHY